MANRLLGVISALPEEFAHLSDRSGPAHQFGGLSFWRGQIAGRDAVFVESGAGKVNAGVATSLLLDRFDCRALMLCGVAGGLDPSFRSGDVVVATEVLSGDARWAAGLSLSDDLIDKLTSGRRRVVRGSLAGAEEVVTGRSCKAALHSETGAAAVDMESHIAAAYAAENELPFAALRVIADPASRTLPALARSAIKPNGEIDLRRILGGLARNPKALRALVSTGLDFNRALKSLRGCRGFLLGGDGLVVANL